MNQAAMIANEGVMPVQLSEEASRRGGTFEIQKNGFLDERHCKMTSKTRFNWLADYINLGFMILSPGDIMIFTGEWLVSYAYCIWITLAISDYARNERQRTMALDRLREGS